MTEWYAFQVLTTPGPLTTDAPVGGRDETVDEIAENGGFALRNLRKLSVQGREVERTVSSQARASAKEASVVRGSTITVSPAAAG